MILLGVTFFVGGSVASLLLPHTNFAFLGVYFLTSVLAFSGIILAIIGIRTALRGSRRDWTIDVF